VSKKINLSETASKENGRSNVDRREEQKARPASGSEVKSTKSNPKLPKTGKEYRGHQNNEDTLPELHNDKADLNGAAVILPKEKE
jgi:hypothetical protein